MAKTLGAVLATLILGAFLTPASAADMGVTHREHVANACPRVWVCQGDHCSWSRSCQPMACPDGFGCYPLYGGYGPWGGLAYSDSFSFKY